MATATPERKYADFEIKELSDPGQFVGLSAVYGNRDRGGDVIVRGAFAKSVAESGGLFPLFYGHKINIGVSRATDTDDGLLVEGRINLEKEIGRDVYSDMKFYKSNGMDYGMSIGYGSFPDRTEFKNGVRYLKEVVLFENTLTELPMNPLARTLHIKALGALESEMKVGRRFSAATRSQFEEIMREMMQKIQALMTDDEGTSDEESGAAKAAVTAPPAESNEPEDNALHSWLSETLAEYKARLASIQ